MEWLVTNKTFLLNDYILQEFGFPVLLKPGSATRTIRPSLNSAQVVTPLSASLGHLVVEEVLLWSLGVGSHVVQSRPLFVV